MKGLFILFLSLSIKASAEEAGQPPACTSKNYNYTGLYHSESYSMPEKSGAKSCQDRKAIDNVKLGELHKANRELISNQIDKMLSNPACKDVHDDLNKYRGNIKKQKQKTEDSFKVVVAWFEEIKDKLDIQRQWAYSAAFNAACASERNTESSFIDLDTLNKILKPSYGSLERNDPNEDCAQLWGGREDSDESILHMKNATGTDFEYHARTVGMAVEVTIKNEAGDLLYDTGCEESLADRKLMIKIPLAKLTGKKDVIIKADTLCDRKLGKGVAGMFMPEVKCEQIEPVCVQPKRELAQLLKTEIEYYKSYLNANATERFCLEHFDENILKAMEEYKLFIIEGESTTNGFCEMFDEACLAEQMKDASKEKVVPAASQTELPQPVSLNIPVETEVPCPDKPDESESILKLISWNYCSIAKKKLELE